MLGQRFLPEHPHEGLEFVEREYAVIVDIGLAQAEVQRLVLVRLHPRIRGAAAGGVLGGLRGEHDVDDAAELLAVELLERDEAAAVPVHAIPHPARPFVVIPLRLLGVAGDWRQLRLWVVVKGVPRLS